MRLVVRWGEERSVNRISGLAEPGSPVFRNRRGAATRRTRGVSTGNYRGAAQVLASEGLGPTSRHRIIGPASPIHRWRACRRHSFIAGGVTVSSGELRDIHSLGRARVTTSPAGGTAPAI